MIKKYKIDITKNKTLELLCDLKPKQNKLLNKVEILLE